MTDKNWEKEMAKIDKQLESVSDAQLFPESKPGAKPAAPAPAGSAAAPSRAEAVRSWPAILRLSLAVLLGVGIMFWPYANRCGIGLAGYLFAVAAVAGSGIWSAVWTWRHRTGRAHALSILLIAWGLILAGAEVLPRTGYAKSVLTWSCVP
jgi:hypothetical protein